DNDLLIAKEEFASQWFAAVLPGRVGGVDAPRANAEFHARTAQSHAGRGSGITPGAVHKRYPIGPEKEANADVAARCAAVCQVQRGDVAVFVERATCGLNGGDEQGVGLAGVGDAVVGEAAVVLNFLNAE